MARTEAVASLVDEDPDLADAVATVLDRTDDGAEPIAWSDVSDDLSSGEWGRLIEAGVLEPDGDDFRLDDPDAAAAAIEDTSASAASDDLPEPSSWSAWDKAAAGVSVAFFAGYSLQQVRSAVGGVVDVALGPLNDVLPFYVVVLVLAVLTGLYSALLQANLTNTEIVAAYQERMQDIQERRKAAKERGDDAALDRIQDEQMDAMGDQLGMFKEQFRPTVWIMLLTIPLFLWMYWMILDGHVSAAESTVVLPLFGQVEWTRGVAGPIQAWIVWYFLCSMGFSQLLRKSMDIQMTPG